MDLNWNYTTHVGRWNQPLASTYERPVALHLEDLAKQYPNVAAWVQAGRVSYLDRSVTYEVPAGGTVIKAVNLTGGFDALVFDRKAGAVYTEAPAIAAAFAELPNERASYVLVQISRQDGPTDTEQVPVNSNFGFGWRANARPVPEFWSGSEIREIVLSNNNNQAVTVTLTFTLVLL